MSAKFTMLLLGPAGSGKSAFISSLSKIDIFKYITAKTLGGANTTKVPTIYEFCKNSDIFNVIECISAESEDNEKMLRELRSLSSEENGVQKVFEKINNKDFSKTCLGITLQLPCKNDLIQESARFDTIVVIDSRGFGDISDYEKIELEDVTVTSDVNSILFFSISAIQQPAIFGKIVDHVMRDNLKTPMFLLRRDNDPTQNDVDFEGRIKDNISNSDVDLFNAIEKIKESSMVSQINTFVFNLPEVKKWKGALNIEETVHIKELVNYSAVSKGVLTYAINMYDTLYDIIVDKLQGRCQDEFVNIVLNNLLTDKAFNVAKNITKYPQTKPYKYKIDRDTSALAYPVCLSNSPLKESQPFKNEVAKRGNQYTNYGDIGRCKL